MAALAARLAALCALVLAVLALGIGPASAHTDLVSSYPAAGSRVDVLPHSVTLEFDEPMALVGDGVELAAPGGERYPADVMVAGGGTVLVVVPMPEPGSSAGRWTVQYAALATDGHVAEGGFEFWVGTSAVMPSGADRSTPSRGLPLLAVGLAGTFSVLLRLRDRAGLRAAVTVGALVGLTTLLLVDAVSTGGAPGAWSSAGLSALARAVGLVAACGTIGALVVAALQVERDGVLLLTSAASRWAAVWLLATVGSVALVAGDLSTQLAAAVAESHGDVDAGEAIRQTVRGGVATAWAAGTVAVVARGAARRRGVLGCLLLAYAALVPGVLAGHSIHAELPVAATVAMVVHVLAATTWVGGLIGIVSFSRRVALASLARGFSAVALWCFVALGVSGLTNLVAQVDLAELLDLGAFGWLVLAKVAVYVVLGGLGLLHRRHALRRLDQGHAGAFWLLVCGEVVLVAGVVAVAAVMGQTPR